MLKRKSLRKNVTIKKMEANIAPRTVKRSESAALRNLRNQASSRRLAFHSVCPRNHYHNAKNTMSARKLVRKIRRTRNNTNNVSRTLSREEEDSPQLKERSFKQRKARVEARVHLIEARAPQINQDHHHHLDLHLQPEVLQAQHLTNQ